MLIYKYLDLPPCPVDMENLKSNLYRFDNKMLLTTLSYDKFIKSDNVELDMCRYLRYQLPARHYIELITSVIPELKGNILDIGLQRIINISKNPNGSIMAPHTDGTKRGQYCIQWIFDTGGPDVHTTWYQEDNLDIARGPGIYDVIDINSIRVIKDVKFPPCCWVMFRTDIVHSVQPVITDRYALTIGFTNDELFDFISSKYGGTDNAGEI